MSAGQQAQSYYVNVVLQSSFSDLLGGQANASVNYFKTSVAQSTSYNFCTTVMSVQTRFLAIILLPPLIFALISNYNAV